MEGEKRDKKKIQKKIKRGRRERKKKKIEFAEKERKQNQEDKHHSFPRGGGYAWHIGY